jgi:hypothetical protein
MNEHNYKIFSVHELNNILCINNDLCNSLNIDCINTDEDIKLIYKRDYIDNFSRFHILPWNENINYWLNINEREILKQEITNYFVNNNNRSKFTIKTKIQNVDFLIE